MRIQVESVTRLRFSDGAPVRAASAVAALRSGHGDGLLVVQDDATHAAWWSGADVTPVRVVPTIEGEDVFSEAAGTKHLKPDLEAACTVTTGGSPAVLLLGSGSSPRRMRAALVEPGSPLPVARAPVDLSALYGALARALGVEIEQLNLEGACVVGEALRWFQRGRPAAGLPTGSVDVDLAGLLDAVRGGTDAADVAVHGVRAYDLGAVAGVGLAITDAVALDGLATGPSLLVSAAAEDTDDPRDDGPVVGSALALLDASGTAEVAELPRLDGEVVKVEGLCLLEQDAAGARLLAVADADDTTAPSTALHLRVRW